MPASRSAMLIASPMPRVPPVTTATRAILPSSRFFWVWAALRAGQPTFKLAADYAAQHVHAGRAVVEAGEVGEMRSAEGGEGVAAADFELFQGLQAVRREARRHHGDPGDALAREVG